MRVLGIEIESRTDILAASAFVLSLGGLVAQSATILKGPHITMDGPKQVLIHSVEYSPGNSYVTISAEPTYVNTGSPGFSDILRSESASLLTDSQSFNFLSTSFIDADSESGALSITKHSSWKPIKLDAGDVSTKTTLFAPEPGQDGDSSSFIDLRTFIKLLGKKDQSATIIFQLHSMTFKKQELIYECELRVADFYSGLIEKGWSAPLCRDGRIHNKNPIGDLFGRLTSYMSR